MPTKQLDRLMFAQGELCFFCSEPLLQSEASVEHLVASGNGGSNNDQNCVACCRSLNSLMGSMSLKEKFRLTLNQKGQFKCPNRTPNAGTLKSISGASTPHASTPLSQKLASIISDLHKRGTARPRTVKTLTSTIGALFRKELSEHEVLSLVEHLKTRGIVIVSDTKVSYALPQKAA